MIHKIKEHIRKPHVFLLLSAAAIAPLMISSDVENIKNSTIRNYLLRHRSNLNQKPTSSPVVVVPPVINNVIVGAYYNDHKNGNISLLESQLGSKLNMEYFYQPFLWNSKVTNQITNTIKENRIPVLSWSTNISESKGTCYNADDIISGKYDSIIRSQAQIAKNFNSEIIITFIPEMTDRKNTSYCFFGNDWYTSSDKIIKAGEKYIKAQNKIVNIFREEKATNVKWSFTPAGIAFAKDKIGDVYEWNYFYPGNEYVDWIGVDYFYGGKENMRFGDNPTIQNFYSQAKVKNKPLIINQTTAISDPNKNPDQQSYWISTAKEDLIKMPEIKAFMWNNNTVRNSLNNDEDTRLFLQDEGVDAFKTLLNDPWFKATQTPKF
jgi:hypothetical protein